MTGGCRHPAHDCRVDPDTGRPYRHAVATAHRLFANALLLEAVRDAGAVVDALAVRLPVGGTCEPCWRTTIVSVAIAAARQLAFDDPDVVEQRLERLLFALAARDHRGRPMEAS